MGTVNDLLFSSMMNLAAEIQMREAEYAGSEFIPQSLLALYDQADDLFCADNVMKLLAALEHWHDVATSERQFMYVYLVGREDERTGMPVPDEINLTDRCCGGASS